jgi:hypothetical protein
MTKYRHCTEQKNTVIARNEAISFWLACGLQRLPRFARNDSNIEVNNQ